MRKINQVVVNAAKMAGDINLFVRIVGRTLYKNLCEKLSIIGEPGVLIVDFVDINQVQDSVLLISIIRALAFCRKNNWRKTIACIAVNELHRRKLLEAIMLWPDVSDLWRDKPDHQKRVLLLISQQANPKQWEILGELNEIEQGLWDKIQDMEQILFVDFALENGMDQPTLLGHLRVFLENQILILSKDGKFALNLSKSIEA